MDKPTPMIVFFTYVGCDHCVAFRGKDGRPSDQRNWNSGFIRTLLTGSNEPTLGRKLKCSRIINIHDYISGNKVENISEFIIYSLIPSDITVYPNLFNDLMEDEPTIIGDSILRVAIKRIPGNSLISISVEIDGDSHDSRCQLIEDLVWDFFFWDRIPIEFHDLRIMFSKGQKFDLNSIVSSSFKNDPFFETLKRDFNKFLMNYHEYENIIKLRFDYDWFLQVFFPGRLREIEIFYPTWMLILPSEWCGGFGNENKVYAKIKGVRTDLLGDRFVSKRTLNEKIEDLILQYYSGRLFLKYSDVLKSQGPIKVGDKKKVTWAIDKDNIEKSGI